MNRDASQLKPEPNENVKTLRDEFAMSALQVIIAQLSAHKPVGELADHAYIMADAMLKRRGIS